MSRAREDILAAIERGVPPSPRRAAAQRPIMPPRFVREANDLVALFRAKLAQVSTSSAVLGSRAELPAHLAEWRIAQGLPPQLLIAPEPDLKALAWAEHGLVPVFQAPQVMAPQTVVSGALAGVAETGSVVLSTAGPSLPLHNLLAETHVVVLSQNQVLASLEDVWKLARGRTLPRSLAFITGASRTGDIEMQIELGVHGAVRMHVVLVEGE